MTDFGARVIANAIRFLGLCIVRAAAVVSSEGKMAKEDTIALLNDNEKLFTKWIE